MSKNKKGEPSHTKRRLPVARTTAIIAITFLAAVTPLVGGGCGRSSNKAPGEKFTSAPPPPGYAEAQMKKRDAGPQPGPPASGLGASNPSR